jgi:hypothetical protein
LDNLELNPLKPQVRLEKSCALKETARSRPFDSIFNLKDVWISEREIRKPSKEWFLSQPTIRLFTTAYLEISNIYQSSEIFQRVEDIFLHVF